MALRRRQRLTLRPQTPVPVRPNPIRRASPNLEPELKLPAMKPQRSSAPPLESCSAQYSHGFPPWNTVALMALSLSRNYSPETLFRLVTVGGRSSNIYFVGLEDHLCVLKTYART